MKTLKKLICIVLVLMTMAAMAVEVFAAGSITRYGCSTAKFTVKTGKNDDKLYFKQYKGVMIYSGGIKVVSEVGTYGGYTIEVTKKGSATKRYYWDYSSSKEIKLDKNSTYTVTVKPYSPEKVGNNHCIKKATVIANIIFRKLYAGNKPVKWEWKSNATPRWTCTVKSSTSKLS